MPYNFETISFPLPPLPSSLKKTIVKATIQAKYGQLAGEPHGWFVCTHTDISYLPQVLESCCKAAAKRKLTPAVFNIFLSGKLRHRCTVADVQSYVKTFLADPLPAITVIPQSPAMVDNDDDTGFAVELLAVSEPVYSAADDTTSPNTIKWNTATASFYFIGSQETEEDDSLPAYPQSRKSFERFQTVLEQEEFNVNDIIRTWIYQGTLTANDVPAAAVFPAVADLPRPQRYQELNRARSDFFHQRKLLGDLLPDGFLQPGQVVYPASTGIGADGYGVTMTCLAVKPQSGRGSDTSYSSFSSSSSPPSIRAIPLENPLQTSAFDYAESYSPQSPKFARALALVDKKTCTVFVSGTASITESETRHVGDPAAQTHQTLDNIAALIAGENLRQYGIESHHFDLTDLVVMRVYIKHRRDVAAIREICEQRCPNVPTIFTIADVCRDDLLVEIEGVAAIRPQFFHRIRH